METSRILALILALAMVFSVLAAFPATVSAASMTDATFFAKLNYAAYPGLSAVKTAVDRGDYTTAKKELLKYYTARRQSTEMGFGVTEADENYGMAVLPMRNILTGPYEFDMWQAEFTVTSSDFKTYEIDVTDRVAAELNNGAVSFMLFAGSKQRYPVIVQSKEAGADVAPKLVIEGTKNATITADNDTYISSQNTGTPYGTDTELYIKEDDAASNNSTGDNTRRTYVNFPLGEVANSTVTSAKLVVSAKYADDCTTGDKDVLVINIGDTMWSESTLTWSKYPISIYSYENLDNPIWAASAPGADGEYHNVTSRFWFGKPMAYEYLSYLKDPEAYNASHAYADTYPGEEFGPKLVELMSAFADQRNYGYTRTLETGERLNRWVDIVDAFLATDVFDGREDMFVNILSFMWGDCNYLNGLDIANESYWWSNWRIVANAGFFKGTEFLYEFNDHDTFRNKVEYNVEWTLDALYNDDMSFTEAGPAYGEWCVKLFGDCAIAADKAGNPMSSTFIEKLRYAARNAVHSFFPDGYDSNVGDSNYRDKMPEFALLAEYLNDPMLIAYVNGDGSYEEDLVAYYDSVNSAYMRTSWDPDETTYVSFVNNPNDGHYHSDSNQVLMYAYGQPLLTDSGRYGYTGSDINAELKKAWSHNTVEAVGVDMGAHTASAEKFSVWADNDLFSFGTSAQHGYPSTTHTRNVLFLKNNGTTLVTDYVDGNTSRTYRQNWHFMPSSNAAVDGQNIATDFYEKANVILANADSDASATVRDGYFSADYGLVAKSEYGSFEKTGTDVKFGTVLYPVEAGKSAKVEAKDIATDINSSAIEFEIDGEKATLYVKNTDSATGKFGAYTTDAKMAYVSDNTAAMVNGKTITGGAISIESAETLDDISITLENGVLAISGSNLMENTTDSAAKITAAGVTSVTLNGEPIGSNISGDTIYAVSIASVTHVETVGEILASKDGFVASSSGNEGPANPSFIQAAAAWQNRNAYMGFDLTDYADADFNKAVIRMYPTEVANGPGEMHFYWLDYGTWTRDNLSFVLDSAKMPTHTANAGTYTGYAGHFAGDASGTSVGTAFDVDFTSQLKERIANGEDLKFTFAMLGSAGSVKFASINNGTYPGPTIILTNEVTEGITKETTVTVNFVNEDGEELLAPVTVTEGLKAGNLYTYDEAPENLEVGGVHYVLNNKLSSLGAMIVEGKAHDLKAVYTKAAEVTVQFTYGGEKVADGEPAYVAPGSTYTFTPDVLYIFDGQAYLSDAERSSLSVKAQKDEDNIIEVVLVKAIISENLLTNGDFTDGTTDWTDAATGAQYAGTVSGNYVHGDGQSLTNTVSAGGSVASTVRRFVPVTAGKTYYLSYYAYNTGAALGTGNNGLMSAFVPVTGKVFGSFDGLTFKDYVEYGGQNSWSPENQSEVKRDRADMPYESGMNHKEFLITIPEGADNIMISMFAWTDPGRLYFSDFELYEIESEIVTVTVPVKYVNAAGEEILPAKSFTAREGDSYDASGYVVNGPIYGNKKIRTYDAAATGDLTGTVTTDTVVTIVYSEEEYDGIILDLSFDDEETGFAGGQGKAVSRGENELVDGKWGKALSLDGTGSNWLNATMAENGGSLLANLEELTISYYSKVENTNTNWPFFAASGAGEQTYQSEHYLGAIEKSKEIAIERYSNGGSRDSSNNVTAAISTDGWRLVTVVVSKGKTEIYIDGAKVSEQAAKNTLADVLGSSPVFQIGKANWGSGEFYNGLIDEFKIYDWALTAEEVAAAADKAPIRTESSLRIIEEDGAAMLGIAFTATVPAAEGATAVGFEYGAYKADADGSYTVLPETLLDEQIDGTPGSFRLVISGISNNNSARTYVVKPYVVINGEKVYGDTATATLYGALADSIMNGKGNSISDARLTAANSIIAFVKKNRNDNSDAKFPGLAEAYGKLYENDELNARAKALGIDDDASAIIEGAMLLSLESVEIEFVETDFADSDADSDITVDMDFVTEL